MEASKFLSLSIVPSFFCFSPEILKDNIVCILHLKPCFKIVSVEIERLTLKFGHMLLAR